MPLTFHSAPHWTRRLVAALLVALAIPALLASPLAERAGATTNDEARFFELLNGARAASGLAPLANDVAAANVARRWSGAMSAENLLHHNPNVASQVTAEVTSAWQRIGENVGVGYSVTSLHDAFMNSPGHRANVLGDYNRVGIGVVNEPSGRMWVTFVFIKGPAIASAPFATTWTDPAGALDSAAPGLGTLRVTGWAIDPDTTGAIDVHVYVGGVGTVLKADALRGDVGAGYPTYGSAHGFAAEVRVPSTPGVYDACAYGINVGTGANSLLGCRRVQIDRDPVGSLDVAASSLGSLRVSGWAIDPDTASPIDVHVWVGGTGSVLKGNQYRGDLAAAFPAFGGGHGFTGEVQLPPVSGVYDLCAYGINAAVGSNDLLGCRTVVVERNPVGSVDGVSRTGGSVRVSGWALDPDTSDPIQVHVYAGAFGTGADAAGVRGDIAEVFPRYGDHHGYDVLVPVGPAPATVCAYGINIAAGGNRLLGCRTV